MSKTIFKFGIDLNALKDDDSIQLKMPTGANPLYATKQAGGIILYAEVDPDAELIERKAYVFGTGRPMRCTYRAEPMGVISVFDDAIMFHVYIEPENVENICTCGNPSGNALLTLPPQCADCGKRFS